MYVCRFVHVSTVPMEDSGESESPAFTVTSELPDRVMRNELGSLNY